MTITLSAIKMVKLNTLQETLKKYPHFFNKEDDSYLTRHLKVVNGQQQDIRHKIKTIEWAKLLEKPLQLWKTQTEPYNYDLNVHVKVPYLKTLKVYRNPILKDNNVLGYDEILLDKEWEDDTTCFYEDRVSLETQIYDTQTETTIIFDEEILHDNGLEEYVIVDELPTPHKDELGNIYFINHDDNSYNAHTIQKLTVNDMGILGYNEEDVYSETIEKTDTLTERLDNEEHSLDINETLDDNFSLKFKTSAEAIIEIHFNRRTFTVNYDSWDIDGEYTGSCDPDIEHEWTIESSNTNDEYAVFSIKCDDETVFTNQTPLHYFTELEQILVFDCTIENVQYTRPVTEHYGYILLYENIPYTVNTETTEYRNIIPLDNFLLEITTHDDYRFLKGYPQNDYTVKEDNILEYRYNTTFLDISQEEISYTKYLTFRVHKDRIKKITILEDEKTLLEQEFITDLIGETKSTDFTYYYYGKEEPGHYEIENEDANNRKLYFADTEKDEYVYRHKLTMDDFDDEGMLKHNYDLIVTTYENRNHCQHNYDRTYSKRYTGYDNELNDCYNHDYSLDIIGNILNVPRKQLYQVDDTQLSETYPPYFNRATEDDYDYMKRIQGYISQYNITPFPVLEFWKHYQVYPELRSRKRIVGEMDESMFQAPNDIICDSDFIDLDTDEKVVGYVPSIATNVQGKSVPVTVGDSVWEESIVANNVYVVPGAEYRFRYSTLKQGNDSVTVRMITYDKDGNSLRSMGVPVDEYDEPDTLYNSTEGYEPVDTKIIMPSNAVKVKLVLESDSHFSYADASLERIRVIDYNNPYQTTDEDYNSNFYEMYVTYEDIPSNIRIGGGERFKWQLRRSLPLTKKGLLYMDVKTPVNESANITTGYNVFIENLIPYENRTGTVSDGIPYTATIHNKLLEKGREYHIGLDFTMTSNTSFAELHDYSQEYADPIPTDEDYLFVELIYDNGTIHKLGDKIYSDTQTHMDYSFTTIDEEWETMTIRIQSDNDITLDNIRLYSKERIQDNVLSEPNVAGLTLTTAQNAIQKDDTLTLTATCVDENSNPVKWKTVYFYQDTNYIGSANTDGRGVATIQYTGKGYGLVNIIAGTDLELTGPKDTKQITDCFFFDKGTASDYNDTWVNLNSNITVSRNNGYTTLTSTVNNSNNRYSLPSIPEQPFCIEFEKHNANQTGAFFIIGSSAVHFIQFYNGRLTNAGHLKFTVQDNQIEVEHDGVIESTKLNITSLSVIRFQINNNNEGNVITFSDFKVYPIQQD